MAHTVRVPDPVWKEIKRVAERYDYSYGEAVRHMIREGDYDV